MKSLKAKFRKSDVHEWNKNDERLLSAVEHGETDKVTSLLSKKGACPTKLDNEGKSALHVAASQGLAECLGVILAHGADVSLPDASGFTALHLAAKNNHPECAKKLIQSKCAVDAVDSSGRTALHHAAASGNAAIVQLLCEHKCHVNLKDSDGVTPLLLSVRHSDAEVCRCLVNWGTDVNSSDRSGRTAVMLASESSCPVTVELLVQSGADLNMVDSLGYDVLYYAKLSGSSDVQNTLEAALHRQQPESDKNSARTPQHGQMAKLNEDRSSTPKKRKAPPPPISPIQSSGIVSPPYFTPSQTPLSSKSDSSRRFDYKEEELKSAMLKVEIEKLHEEKSMLLETIDDLKQIVEQTEPKAREEGQGGSRPNSIESNASYHSTRADFEISSDMHVHSGDDENLSEVSALDISGSCMRHEVEETVTMCSDEEIKLLRGALENLQAKLMESRMENRSLQARLNTDSPTERTECGDEDNVVQKFQYLKSCLEQEVKDLKVKLLKAREEQKRDACSIKDLQSQIQRSPLSEDERFEMKNTYNTLVENINQEKALLIEKYKESQDEIKMLQEALQGTVSVEAAANDFEEMKAELGEIIDGLQRRLLELSKSYSEAKSELSAARNQMQAKSSEKKPDVVTKEEHERKIQELTFKMKDVQNISKDTEVKLQAALGEIAQVKEDAEKQVQSTVAIADHTQVVASLGNAIKNLEAEVEVLQHQLAQKTFQVEGLQNKVENNVTPDTISRLECEEMREKLECEINDLSHLLKDALRKQDEMALEVTAAWQEVKDGRNEREAAQELAVSREKECSTMTARFREAQDIIVQMKKQVENHVISEREKNKKIDELSKEVVKLKEALNSLSQLSYTTNTPKRQQNQQVDSLHQQIKQLQYQLAESKKRHHEVVSVYRMHLLYAVQGQMDEDVQKALKQILVMCKMPTEAK
ncbi:Ankycorbin Ankyrin repeat and coiled-coil structure-containing protein [Triplophysa tibetana]|uniref:Ankycorbin Ankyrin repeat and coiled-coil structure-containing protein n=1 Tax=Triplophysa tibetana TaxID=1572043 RepID=A0A5A9PH05_9TELE|nr:Ankycorbin Ankyrin repeat and coiled-coil structure-containing protein [Triplophysa tibetana]